MMEHVCCGTCKWFELSNGGPWGWCRYIIPPIPFPIPTQCSLGIDAGWRDLEITDGEECPTWEAQPCQTTR